jgi:hypothetical protein
MARGPTAHLSNSELHKLSCGHWLKQNARDRCPLGAVWTGKPRSAHATVACATTRWALLEDWVSQGPPEPAGKVSYKVS